MSHRHSEFALVTDLERLHSVAKSFNLNGLAEDIEHTRSNIACHRFSIAVVGEFKRGKSTFINALLGKEILPADIAPTSATINRITYGLKPAVRILFRDNTEEVVDVAQLAQYVTKLTPAAQAMASTIREAVVEYPVAFCKHNVDIVDTPGLADDPAMSSVTLSFLSRVDAAVLVVMATAPFSQSEAEFLDKLLLEYGLGSVLFVVTAIDRLRRPEDRDQILSTVAQRIQGRIERHAQEHFGSGTVAYEEYVRRIGRPRIFGVSGYDALTAKVQGDDALLAESRLPEFEAFLERFLAEESGLVALKTHAERLAIFATALRREVKVQLGSPMLAPPAIFQDSQDGLLRSLEWLAHDAKRALDEQRRRVQLELRSLLQPLSQELLKAAARCLADIDATTEDLESPRLQACIDVWREKLTDVSNQAIAAKAGALVSTLQMSIIPAVEPLLRFATTFDRVMAHVCAPPEPQLRDEASALHSSLVERLGGTNAFEDTTVAQRAVERMFEAYGQEWLEATARSLAMDCGWAADIDVQPMQPAGPKFTRKAVDLVRVEKFKMDLRGALTEALKQHLLAEAPVRDEALNRHVALPFAALVRDLDHALDAIRERRLRLQAGQQRRIAFYEHERHRLEQLDIEIGAIYDRAKASVTSITNH
jgi:hypothetical protein